RRMFASAWTWLTVEPVTLRDLRLSPVAPRPDGLPSTLSIRVRVGPLFSALKVDRVSVIVRKNLSRAALRCASDCARASAINKHDPRRCAGDSIQFDNRPQSLRKSARNLTSKMNPQPPDHTASP
ncbi:MAG: hypothetical protein ABWX87_00850, partial [Pseudoxanthomonas sp.]